MVSGSCDPLKMYFLGNWTFQRHAGIIPGSIEHVLSRKRDVRVYRYQKAKSSQRESWKNLYRFLKGDLLLPWKVRRGHKGDLSL